MEKPVQPSLPGMETTDLPPVQLYVHGRSIVKAIHVVLLLWGVFRGSLATRLPAPAVTALDALQSAWPDILSINPPGPG